MDVSSPFSCHTAPVIVIRIILDKRRDLLISAVLRRKHLTLHQWAYCYVSYLLFLCSASLIDFQILSQPCILGTNPPVSWYIIYFVHAWIWFTSIFLRISEFLVITDNVCHFKILFVWDRVLCNQGCPWALELSTSVSWVLGSQVCACTPDL